MVEVRKNRLSGRISAQLREASRRFLGGLDQEGTVEYYGISIQKFQRRVTKHFSLSRNDDLWSQMVAFYGRRRILLNDRRNERRSALKQDATF